MLKVVTDVCTVEDWNEVRYANMAIEGFHSHGKLIAKIAHGSQAHSGYAQMFTQSRGGFHVVLVERHHAVDLLRTREMGDGFHHIGHEDLPRTRERVGLSFPGPASLPKFFSGEKHNPPPLSPSLRP